MYYLAPVSTLVFVVAVQVSLWALRRRVVPLLRKQEESAPVRQPFLVLRKLPVTIMVIVFYAYPILLRAALSFFACLRIDKPLSALRLDSVPEKSHCTPHRQVGILGKLDRSAMLCRVPLGLVVRLGPALRCLLVHHCPWSYGCGVVPLQGQG